MSDAVRRAANAAGLALAVVLILGLALPAQATVFPAVGGRGDHDDMLVCTDGKLLVGFHGRTGSWIDRIGLICAAFTGPAYASGRMTLGAAKGGNGGSYAEHYCPADAGIRAITPNFLDKDYEHKMVSSVAFSCSRPRDGSAAGEGKFAGDLGGYVGSDFDRIRTGAPQRCTGNEYAIGLTVRYGKHVNAVGLICGAVGRSAGAGNAGSAGNAGNAGKAERIEAGMENDTDRAGSDYRRFTLDKRDPSACQRACADDRERCRAWTYVRPGVQGPRAVCYLKDRVPSATRNACCISGVGPKKIVGLGKKTTGPLEPGPGDIAREPGGVAPPPARCKSGYVWREARPTDYVCVTPESRTLVKQENAVAPSRRDPNGAWGPQSCISGFVWREAFDGDTVCVTPERRTAVKEENRVAPSRTER